MDRLSDLKLFIASKESWYGIIASTWPFFELQEHNFSFNTTKAYWMDMYVTDIQFREGHQSIEECIENIISTNQLCGKCTPFFLSFLNISGTCQKNEDNKCWYNWIFANEPFMEYKNCMKPKNTMIYRTKPVPYESLIEQDKVQMEFTFASDEITIQEETLMIDACSYIGSVGGSLGLFLGFSFFTFLSSCVEKLFDICSNKG